MLEQYPPIRVFHCAAIALFLALALEELWQIALGRFSTGSVPMATSSLCASVVFLLTFASLWNSKFETAVLPIPAAGMANASAVIGITERPQNIEIPGNNANLGRLRQAEEKLQESEEKYRLLVATIPEVLWKTDTNGNIIFVSPQVDALLGYSADEFLQQGDSLWFSLVHPDDKDKVVEAFESLIKLGEPYDIECRARKKSGEWLWVHDRAVVTSDSNGFRTVTGLISDITVRKRAEESLLFKTALLEAQAETTIDGILVVDESDRIVLANKRFGSQFGIPDELLSTRDDQVVLKHVTDKVEQPIAFVERVKYLNSHRDEKSRDELRFKNGKIFDRYSAPLVDSRGQYRGRIWYFRDITDRKAAEHRIQYLAYYDDLTGLPNRTLLQDRLDKAVADARRQKHKVALLFLDLDGFKDINDSLGHSAGDLLLQGVAERLKKWGREQDTVARLGGDEFLGMLTYIRDVPGVAVAAERLMDVLDGPFVIQGHSLHVNCSVGISIFPENGEDGESLIKNADAAMYSAKQSGRRSFRFFTEELNTQAVERLTLENGLRSALARAELFLMYQPQMNIVTGKITGLEALLRWHHPELGLVPPAKFVRIAENTGLILPIGEWVLSTACSQVRKWQKDGFPGVTVAVNVSAIQFRQACFCGLVRKVLQETGLAPQYLELELTESLLLTNAELMVSVVQELRDIGVTLAIDDFGTGYSNFGYLRRLQISKLKIDRSFISDVATNPDVAAITAAIISMAKNMRLKVIAEGVEDEAQMLFLRAHQCDEIQGYYFSKPLAVDDVADQFRQTDSALNDDGEQQE